jgi:hypothetical protein
MMKACSVRLSSSSSSRQRHGKLNLKTTSGAKDAEINIITRAFSSLIRQQQAERPIEEEELVQDVVRADYDEVVGWDNFGARRE